MDWGRHLKGNRSWEKYPPETRRSLQSTRQNGLVAPSYAVFSGLQHTLIQEKKTEPGSQQAGAVLTPSKDRGRSGECVTPQCLPNEFYGF